MEPMIALMLANTRAADRRRRPGRAARRLVPITPTDSVAEGREHAPGDQP